MIARCCDVLVAVVPRWCGSTRQLRDSRGDTRWSRSCSSPRPPPSLSPSPRREHSREILAARPAEAAQVRSLDRDNVTVTVNILNMFFVDISEIGDVYYINRGVDSIQSISMRQYEVRRV